jgi:Cu/Ag efflux protein CusF
MKTKFLLPFLALLPAALFAAAKSTATEKNCGCACCEGKEVCCCRTEKTAGTGDAAAPQTHPLRGTVVKLLPDSNQVRVKHEAIPRYMPAMTMSFNVAPADYARLRSGDAITATLESRSGEFWLNAIKVTSRAAK